MTSITSVLSNRYHQYPTSQSTSSTTTDDSLSSLLSGGSSGAASASSSSSSSDDQSQITAAEQLIAQLMNMILNLQSGNGGADDSSASTSDGGSVDSTAGTRQPSSAATSQGGGQSNMIDAMDTNGDGNISEAEFVAARPSGVSADQAKQLFQSFDENNTGSLTKSQLASSMHAGHHHHGGGALSDNALSDIFSSMDTDGDGNVTQAEFVAARPSDVSEDQATSLFQSLDTSGSGSLTQSQFESAVRGQQSPMPDFGSLYTFNEQDQTTSDLLTL